MIESYLDCVTGDTLIEAKELANEQIKRMSQGNWMMVQCQHSYLENERYHVYSMVYQRTKEQIIKRPHATEEQSAGEIPVGDEPQAS